MMKELYVVNANGQMEMNFEALELITSEKFTNNIKHSIEIGFNIVSFEKNDVCVFVILKDGDLLNVQKYYFSTGHTSDIYLNRNELGELLSFFEGGL